jgi:Chemotaxis protein histidine kinase and related kinases
MSDAHRKAFVAESEEGITELNNALLDLEADPDDDDAMDSIFRIAHTLKGNASAMGFESVSELAHEMEDLLDEVREGQIDVDIELMDLLFDSVDYLDAMVGDIAEDGETDIDASGVEADLREKMETGSVGDESDDSETADDEATESADDADTETDAETTDEGTVDDESGASETAEETEEPAVEAEAAPEATAEAESDGDTTAFTVNDLPEEIVDSELETSEAVYRAEVGLGDTEMPGVEAIFIMQELEGAYDRLGTDPAQDTIEDGDFQETFDVFVIDISATEIKGILSELGKVEFASVEPVTPNVDDPMTVAEAVEADRTPPKRRRPTARPRQQLMTLARWIKKPTPPRPTTTVRATTATVAAQPMTATMAVRATTTAAVSPAPDRVIDPGRAAQAPTKRISSRCGLTSTSSTSCTISLNSL